LDTVRCERTATPIGLIGRVELNWDLYRLEVWGPDTHGPALCALQLYQMPSTSQPPTPDRPHSSALGGTEVQGTQGTQGVQGALSSSFGTPGAGGGVGGALGVGGVGGAVGVGGVRGGAQQLFLVEFVRFQLEIFSFKRFYQWVRQRLSELVKRDYACNLFDQAASPK
jgi:hypothetical protein